jgi:hypothetical protein
MVNKTYSRGRALRILFGITLMTLFFIILITTLDLAKAEPSQDGVLEVISTTGHSPFIWLWRQSDVWLNRPHAEKTT